MCPAGTVADHASKVFTGTFKTRVQDDIVKSFRKKQYGGTKGGGTLFAAMSTLLFIQYCIALNLSVAILFVDLSKALDYAIREILLGWMPGFNGSKRELLRPSGVGEECIEELIHYIDTTGGLLVRTWGKRGVSCYARLEAQRQLAQIRQLRQNPEDDTRR